MSLGDRMHDADDEIARKEALADRLERSLTNVTPTVDGINRIERVREVGKKLGSVIIWNCPLSREQSLALTHLEDAIMWAVKSIVLEEGDDE